MDGEKASKPPSSVLCVVGGTVGAWRFEEQVCGWVGEHGGHKVTGFSKDLNCILKVGVEAHARKALVSKTAILPSSFSFLVPWLWMGNRDYN